MSTKSDQLEWRRSKVVEMRARGMTDQDIAHELQVLRTSITSDMQYLRSQAKQSIKEYVTEHLPEQYLILSLFAYPVTAIIVGGNWNQILDAALIPHIEFTPAFAMMSVAIFGTTISPYLFFLAGFRRSRRNVAKHRINEIGTGQPKISKNELTSMRQDTAVGMALSQLIMWAILITTAGSLHAHGVSNIQTADQAAKALEPLVKTFPYADEISKTVFALGVTGTGLLAVPVLAGSSGYAVSDAFGWREGLSKQFKQAKGFCVVIAASTVIVLWINFIHADPIKALVYTALINGIIAVPILFAVMKIANDKKTLRDHTNKSSTK